jgi:hypothetical protein
MQTANTRTGAIRIIYISCQERDSMGTFGVGLFHDDVALDVRDQYLDLLAGGASDTEAFRTMVREWNPSFADYDDEGPVFWLALAATQWEYGRLHPRAKAQALKIIDQGKGLDRWAEAGLAKKRQAVLARLKKKLLSPPPKKRTPRPRRIPEPESFSLASPDQKAIATAWLVGIEAGRPISQVCIETKVKGFEGGGSVFVAYCALTNIKLKWLDGNTLQITYPKEAEVQQQKPTHFYYGRTIAVRYRRFNAASDVPRAGVS